MQLTRGTWESALLDLATQAQRIHPPKIQHLDPLRLTDGHAHAEAITAHHSKSFSLASGLLPPAQRQAVRALYAFCRTVDDLADCTEDRDEALAHLQDWRQRGTTWDPPVDDPVALAWADARSQYAIPSDYVQHLIDALEGDFHRHRYATFDELTVYCYGVASTVGLMSMHIIGYEGDHALPYAIKLGVALQLTNILRDIGEDWERGRFYLPLDELAHFGLSEADIAAGEVDDRWRAFMRFQIERTRRLYAESLPGIALLHRGGRLAVAAAATFYQHILDDIEAHDYDVFNRRAHVSTWGKVRRIPALWWQWGRGA